MDTGNTLGTRMQAQVARWLARRAASPVILAGTLALAGLGSAALSATPIQHGLGTPSPVVGTSNQPASPDLSNCFADPDGDGSLVCYIEPSQISAYPNAYCHPDPDGDGHLVCHIRSH